MTEPAQDQPPQDAVKPDTGAPDLTAEVEKWKALARKHEQKAKDLAPAAQRLAELEQASQSETERAVAKARQEADQSARAEERGTWAQRLAAAQFVALAARRNAKFDAQAVLDDLNLARYVGDDGEPDDKALDGVVDRLVPAPQDGPPNFDGGARLPGLPADPRLRDLAQIESDLTASRRKK